MKAVKEKLGERNPARVADFEKKAATYAKKIVANFKDFEFVRFFPSRIRRVLTHENPSTLGNL